MRKTLSAFFVLLFLSASIGRSQFTFTTNNGAITITGYSGTSGAIIIPTATNGWPVTAIGIGAFQRNLSVTSVVIPGNVLTIGTNAFASCTKLTNLVLGTGVADIQPDAFDLCSGLVNLTVPGSVTTLGSGSFAQCSSLTNIFFPGNAPMAGTGVFSSDTDATIYYQPGGTGWSTPYGGAPAVMLPFSFILTPGNTNTVTITGWSNLGGVAPVIPSTILGLPVVGIADQAFAYSDILSVTIPGSVTTISDQAFWECYQMISVNLTSGLTRIGSQAFGLCTKLENLLVIPTTVTNIGTDAFQAAAGSLESGNLYYSGSSGFIFNSNQTTIDACPYNLPKNYVIPNTVTNIAPGAFDNCYGPTNITIPVGTISIGKEAFSACQTVQTVTIPSNVTSIGSGAFAECANLTTISVDPLNSLFTSVSGVLFDGTQSTLIQYPGGVGGPYTVPTNVTQIAAEAFAGCSCSVINIPSGVTNIGDNAFGACPNLSAINVDPQNPDYSSIGGVLFDASQATLTLKRQLKEA